MPLVAHNLAAAGSVFIHRMSALVEHALLHTSTIAETKNEMITTKNAQLFRWPQDDLDKGGVLNLATVTGYDRNIGEHRFTTEAGATSWTNLPQDASVAVSLSILLYSIVHGRCLLRHRGGTAVAQFDWPGGEGFLNNCSWTTIAIDQPLHQSLYHFVFATMKLVELSNNRNIVDVIHKHHIKNGI